MKEYTSTYTKIYSVIEMILRERYFTQLHKASYLQKKGMLLIQTEVLLLQIWNFENAFITLADCQRQEINGFLLIQPRTLYSNIQLFPTPRVA